MRRPLLIANALAALATPAAAAASELITYTYDARGRVQQVAHSGNVNSGVSTAYVHDKANNRQTKTTTAIARIFVVPLTGMAVIRRA